MPEVNNMFLPHHFPDPLVSVLQSAVARVVMRPQDAARSVNPAAARGAPSLDLTDEMVTATAKAAANAAGLGNVQLVTQTEHCAAAYLELAKAKFSGDAAALARANAQLAKCGECDPRWSDCLVEFTLHYALTKHGNVPYKRWSSLDDFVLDLPSDCRIGIIGDWGTGGPRAQALLRKVATHQPQILMHLGDVYYSCDTREAAAFYDHCRQVFPDDRTRIFTLCGNHDMYGGGAPYYALLDRLKQPASFFCLRNASWQLLALDTGYNDFDPYTVDEVATWVQDIDDRTDPYSELDWHVDKLHTANGRKTILLSHHPLFTRNSAIAGGVVVNGRLREQFGRWLGQITLWLWGHEHNQVIYQPFEGLERGRCIGASAVPVYESEKIYKPDKRFLDQNENPKFPIPELVSDPKAQLAVDSDLHLYNLGYAVLDINEQKATIEYYQYNPRSDESKFMFSEDL